LSDFRISGNPLPGTLAQSIFLGKSSLTLSFSLCIAKRTIVSIVKKYTRANGAAI
jgi:hypothetical protein